MVIYTYINGQYVEAVWDKARRAYVFPTITIHKETK